jgi:dihydroflavonol-4-reductase
MLNVVTGATGHLGNNLVRSLLERGEQVRVVVLPNDPAPAIAGLPVERVEGDVRDLGSLIWAFRNADRVFHLASLITITPGRSDLLQQVNVQGTRNVVEACLRSGTRRLIYVSSIHALVEPPHGTLIDESMPFDPTRIATEYGRSKAQAAIEILAGVERGLDAVIICPTGIVGPHDFQPSEVGRLFLNVARRRMPAYVQGAYDFADVRDVVQGLLAAAEKGGRGEKYILSGETTTVRRMMGYLEESAGVRAPRLGLPANLARSVAKLALSYARWTKTRPLFTDESVDILSSNCCISHEKATRELGYSPRPFRETVRDTIHWFRAAGMLAPRRAGAKRTRHALPGGAEQR